VSSRRDHWWDIIESTDMSITSKLVSIIESFAKNEDVDKSICDKSSICDEIKFDKRSSNKQSIANISMVLKDYEHEKSILQTRNIELSRENEDLIQENENLEKHITNLEFKISDLKNEIESLKRTNLILSDENSSLKIDCKQQINEQVKEFSIAKVILDLK